MQQLACGGDVGANVTSAMKLVSIPAGRMPAASKPPDSKRTIAFISVGSYQPTARMYVGMQPFEKLEDTAERLLAPPQPLPERSASVVLSLSRSRLHAINPIRADVRTRVSTATTTYIAGTHRKMAGRSTTPYSKHLRKSGGMQPRREKTRYGRSTRQHGWHFTLQGARIRSYRSPTLEWKQCTQR